MERITIPLNSRLTFARIFIAMGVLAMSGCATVDQAEDGVNSSSSNLSYDGMWIAKVSKYRTEQLADGFGNSRIRWDCGDGKPFEFKLYVKDGSVNLLSGKSVKVGKVSGRSKFKSIYAIDAEFSKVYTGNFKKKVGKIQSRKHNLNGCQFKFELEKI